MKNRNIRYLSREGIRNIGINKLMSVASIAVLMSCLVIIGFAVLLYLNIDSLMQHIGSQNVIMAFCEVDADDMEIQNIENSLKLIDNIESIEFVSKQEAYDSVIGELGDNANIIQNIDNSFLPVSFRIHVKDMALFSETVAKIENISNVTSVRSNSDLADKFEEIRVAVTYISIGVIIVLFVVSMFIVANTVRITMFSRKLEISIMKAVGATNWFIRWPFLIEGVTIGFISSVLSFAVLALLYNLLDGAFTSIFSVVGNSIVNFWDYSVILFAGFVLVSICVGGLGSIISMRKYLKEQGSVVLDE